MATVVWHECSRNCESGLGGKVKRNINKWEKKKTEKKKKRKADIQKVRNYKSTQQQTIPFTVLSQCTKSAFMITSDGKESTNMYSLTHAK